MANEPTVELADNAMTTLEDTMERLGIPAEAADTAVKNIDNRLRLPTLISIGIHGESRCRNATDNRK